MGSNLFIRGQNQPTEARKKKVTYRVDMPMAKVTHIDTHSSQLNLYYYYYYHCYICANGLKDISWCLCVCRSLIRRMRQVDRQKCVDFSIESEKLDDFVGRFASCESKQREEEKKRILHVRLCDVRRKKNWARPTKSRRKNENGRVSENVMFI